MEESLINSLHSSSSKLSSQSRTIPSTRDFHFFNNFPHFKSPAAQITQTCSSSLNSLHLLPSDLDDAFDTLVDLNDSFLEKFGISLDEYRSLRAGVMDGEGFQMVVGGRRRSKKMREEESEVRDNELGVKVGVREKDKGVNKPKVPFHIASIPRPQMEFGILVNNKNVPFEHVWLERSADGTRPVHPLENLCALDFVDISISEGELVKPLPVESSPFKLVEGVTELKELAAKLRDVNEFAVDLEHNQYRSFQGLTCLMQISTRTEDFIVDTLKLRVHVGPYMREVFKDPSKRKVMHGADRDIEWLQRDFGIYVCNLFDTGQASRVMQLERNSLEYLLHHFCEVTANKEYQNADWRLRPLPCEMLKYAREDTHYLLHMYDLMRSRLISESSVENDLLLEVYKRSYDICMHLYKKELLTDTSYLYIYGLQEAGFNSKQLAIVAGLYAWRDKIARDEDESTGYILPNKALLEIARQMPLSSGKLRWLVKSKHTVVERHLNSVINIIRHSIENSSAFESIAEELKNARLESTVESRDEVVHNSLAAEDPVHSTIAQRDGTDVADSAMQSDENVAAGTDATYNHVNPIHAENISGQVTSLGNIQQETTSQPISVSETRCSVEIFDSSRSILKEKMYNGTTELLQSTKKPSIASVQIPKKQSSAFGMLLGNSSSRRKPNPDNGVINEQERNERKVEKIKSAVIFPFFTFSGGANSSEPGSTESIRPEAEISQQCTKQPSQAAALEDVIQLENNETDNLQSSAEIHIADNGSKHREWFPQHPENGIANSFQLEPATEDDPISLSDLSSSFQQMNEKKNSCNETKMQNQDPVVNFQPFDYVAARKNMIFGKVRGEVAGDVLDNKTSPDSGDKRRRPAVGQANGEARARGLRRQAFPASGNRSTSYK